MTETPTQDPVDERALWSEIDALTEANRRSRDPEVEQRLAALRHQAGIELVKDPPSDPSFVEPDFDQLDESSDLPEVTPEQLTPELVRAAILSKGCLLVRGLLDRDDATEMAAEIERAFETRYSLPEGEQSDDGYYYEMKPIPPYTLQARGFVKNSGGIWAPDSPKVLFDVLDAFERNGLGELAEAYLGERPAITVQKCTLRQVSPDAGNGFPGWHQDGAFLGDVRSLNVWLNLTRCGDGSAPGLDLLPAASTRSCPPEPTARSSIGSSRRRWSSRWPTAPRF